MRQAAIDDVVQAIKRVEQGKSAAKTTAQRKEWERIEVLLHRALWRLQFKVAQ